MTNESVFIWIVTSLLIAMFAVPILLAIYLRVKVILGGAKESEERVNSYMNKIYEMRLERESKRITIEITNQYLKENENNLLFSQRKALKNMITKLQGDIDD